MRVAVPIALLAVVLIGLILWAFMGGPDKDDVSPGPDIAKLEKQAEEGRVDTNDDVLRGRVVEAGGTPIAGARVKIGEAKAMCDGHGLFSLPHPGAGVHEVAVEKAGFLFARKAGTCCESIRVDTPAKDALLTLRMHRPAGVRGTVVSAGRPVEGASFRARYRVARGLTRDVAELTVDVAGKSGRDGRFELAGLPAGRLRIESVATTGAAVGTVIDLAPGATYAPYVIEIRAVAGLAGQVLSTEGAPVPGAIVGVGDTGGDWQATADGNGRFQIAGIAAGTWMLDVSASGFTRHQEASVAFHPHSQLSRTFKLGPIRGIAGRVVDPAGAGIANATVVIKRGDEEHWVRTAAGGAFQYGEVADDVRDAMLTAVQPRFEPPKPVRVVVGTEMVLRLGPGGTIRGKVVHADGSVEKAATVLVTHRAVGKPDPHGQPSNLRTVAKVDGTFELGPLRPGAYDLLARAEKRQPGIAKNIVVKGGQTTMATITMDAGARLVGVVHDQDNTPVGGAHVDLYARLGAEDSRKTTTTAADGSYMIEKLPPGNAKLRVTKSGHLATVVAVTVPARGDVAGDVTLRRAATGSTAVVDRIGAKLVETPGGYALAALDAAGKAAGAGLKKGDVVASVDFTATESMTLQEAANALNNAPPTMVTVEVIGADGQKRSVYLDL